MDQISISEPPVAGNEVESIVGSLERQRRIFAWKASDLTDDQMKMGINSSSMTVGGLIKHLALVEHEYFRLRIAGLLPREPWSSVDFEIDPMWEWESASTDSSVELEQIWRDAVYESRAILARVRSDAGLDTLAKWSYRDGRTPTVRRFLFDLIEEYARHNGHLDLMREMIDGRVGEDPPRDFSF